MRHDLRALAGLLVLLAAFPAARAHAQDSPRFAPRQIIVRLAAGAGDGAALRAELGASVARRFDSGAELWTLGSIGVAEAVERLQHDARVERIEPNYIIRAQDVVPDDPRFAQQWALQNTGQSSGKIDADIDATGAWSFTTGGPVLIGVLDSGIDPRHPDLAASIYTNPGEIDGNLVDDDGNGFVDDVHGWDFVNDDNDPNDGNGHGTHVAGTIAAAGNNGTGIAGVAWNARILPLKILDVDAVGTVADAVRAIEYATRMGVRLTNNSWGGFTQSYALRAAIAAARDRGILFVASAGNDARDIDRFPFYPAAYPLDNVISVASTDRNDVLSAFSSFGALGVHLAAPGTGIVSTFPGNLYGSLSGTSMSAAFVSGAACLLWGRAPLLTHDEVKNAILSSVDPLPALSGVTRTGGRLNVRGLVSVLDTVAPAPVVNLAVESVGSSAVRLSWTASGDDGTTGTARRYELRYALQPINFGNVAVAQPADGVPAPRLAGSFESFEVSGLSFLVTYHFALIVEDEAGNRSILSNGVSATTLGVPQLEHAPDSFVASLHVGATSSQILSLTNTGNGTLDFVSVETPPWVRLDPSAGRVGAGETRQIVVRFDATDIPAGFHGGAILLATNVPGQAAVSLPLSLQVAGAPDITSSPVMDFGGRFDPCAFDSLLVSNRGTTMLQVSGVSVSEGSFTADPAPFLLGPGETRPIAVIFCPEQPGRTHATLHVHSNDPDHPVLSVGLRGRSLAPPAISVSPPSLSANVYSGGAATRTLEIANTGTADLHYEIAIVEPDGASIVDHVATVRPRGDVVATGRPLTRAGLRRLPMSLPREFVPSPDGTDALVPSAPRRSGAPAVLERVGRARLEEVFGSTENQFVAATRMRGNFYACTKSTNLREHRFYLNPASGGEIWLLVYEGLTQSGVYELVSASDITPSGDIEGWYSSGVIQAPLQAGRYYFIAATFEPASEYYLEGNITPYPVPASFGELIGGAGTTWNPLTGFPPFQFQFVPPSAFGQPVAYYQTLVTDGVVTWASLDRGEGTLARGRSLQLGVDLRAGPGFPDGAHAASLRIASNDPLQPEVVVPLHLNVAAAPNLALSEPAIEFGECYAGFAVTDTIVVSNTGTQTLQVTSLSTNLPHFAVQGTGFSLVPNQNIVIPVTFTAPGDGPIDGTLTIASNDPDAPAVVVELRGRRAYPPSMSVSPSSFDEVLAPGSIASRIVSITNSGAGELSFEIDANVMADPVMARAAMTGHPADVVSTDITPATASRTGVPSTRTYSGVLRERVMPASAGTVRAVSEGALRVLLLHASSVSEIRDALLEFADFSLIDEFDAAVATPSLATLAGYHAVILISDLPYQDQLALGDALADYVDQGGGVVMTLASFVVDFDVLGRFGGGGYAPFTPGYGPNGFAALGARDVDHALMKDVTAASGDLLGVTILEPDARWVAGWNNGLPFVATRGDRIVGINVYLGNGGFWTGDIPVLVRNAVRWVTRTPWLRATPARGIVPPHTTVNVALAVAADRLAPGDYFATLRVAGNDPGNANVVVPVTLVVDSTTTTGIPGGGVPERFALLPNRPNPFNPSTTIAYELPRAAQVRLVVYDVSGRQVRELVGAMRPAGRHSAGWDGRDDANRAVASGVYFYRLTAGDFAETKKMVLLK